MCRSLPFFVRFFIILSSQVFLSPFICIQHASLSGGKLEIICPVEWMITRIWKRRKILLLSHPLTIFITNPSNFQLDYCWNIHMLQILSPFIVHWHTELGKFILLPHSSCGNNLRLNPPSYIDTLYFYNPCYLVHYNGANTIRLTKAFLFQDILIIYSECSFCTTVTLRPLFYWFGIKVMLFIYFFSVIIIKKKTCTLRQ